MSAAEVLSKKMEKELGFPPTPCQSKLFCSFAEFLCSDSDSEWMMVVSGYAGTGKTSALASFIKLLKEIKHKYILLAPTGRAAKVLSNFTGEKACTVHKQIYRQKSLSEGGFGIFSLDFNKSKDTIFIVDEASLLQGGGAGESMFGTGDVLADLMTYIRSDVSNKLILTGDPAQLPPVGLDCSPALDVDYLSQFASDVKTAMLYSVVRQASESGILHNATLLRQQIEDGDLSDPLFEISEFPDIESIAGDELIEKIDDSVRKYGEENVVVLCRSNSRAVRYNIGIRSQVLFREEQLCCGDRLMIVKNCYHFDNKSADLDFIANGDIAELIKISNYQERYGLHFASATLAFPDYGNAEVKAKIILDTLTSNAAALGAEAQKQLYFAVNEDYANIANKRKRYMAVREDPYFNALQIKYSAAITGHKSQGGQWKCVFIDNILWKDDIELEDKKWLYTAMTRGVEKVYLVNFAKKFIEQK